jgi:hypothetical protein
VALVAAFQQTAPSNVAGNLAGTTNEITGNFVSTPLSAYPPSIPSASLGQCTVSPIVQSVSIPSTFLDAGVITVTAPVGSAVPIPELATGFYQGELGSGAIPATGGSFVFKGAGGRDVGPFTATVTLSNPLFSWTNQASATAITRSQGLQIQWSGGNAGDIVAITGSSIASGVGAIFSCGIPVSAGQFTVPPYILLGLPFGTGTIFVGSVHNVSYTATGLPYPGSASAGAEITLNTTFK